ncbi:MAG: NADH-quinone oxidoreductase subunit D, partial [Candidatus Micrarchaeota archaeon]|nr:NADH-quinone oxidoreductase subunit D [Candidatus Micrarchaeota archaeon]
YRIYMRSPAFANLSILSRMSVNAKFADLFPVLGSIDIVLAEVDR